MVGALSATSYVSIPLSGPNLESLRQMRLSRDGKRDPICVVGSGEAGCAAGGKSSEETKRPRKDPTWNFNHPTEDAPDQGLCIFYRILLFKFTSNFARIAELILIYLPVIKYIFLSMPFTLF